MNRISNLVVMGWAFIRLDHRAPVIQSNFSFFTISRNTNVEGLVLFLTNNGTLRLRKKLLLWIGCVLGIDSGVSSVPKFSAHGLFTKLFIAHRASYLVFPVHWMEQILVQIPNERRKFLSWLSQCERTNHVCSGSRTKR